MPGVGRKSAQRIAFHLLERDRAGAEQLSKALAEAVAGIRHCGRCRMLTEQAICSICESASRDESLLCIVESPADVMAVEDATGYKGLYFVLMGHLSPLDGIGPQELGLKQLEERLASEPFQEVIIATNPTVEGEATALYLARLLKPLGARCTRIAMGVPVGSDLDYTDEFTMSKSMEGRREM